jgi:hypothetical protein
VELAAIVGGERRATGSEVGEEGNEVEEVEGLGDGRVEPGERVVPPRRPAARRCLRRRRNLHFISSDFFLWPPFDVVDIVFTVLWTRQVCCTRVVFALARAPSFRGKVSRAAEPPVLSCFLRSRNSF